MSDGIAWAYEYQERKEKLKSLGLCTFCEKSRCFCSAELEIQTLERKIRFIEADIKDFKADLKYNKKLLESLKERLANDRSNGKVRRTRKTKRAR